MKGGGRVVRTKCDLCVVRYGNYVDNWEGVVGKSLKIKDAYGWYLIS